MHIRIVRNSFCLLLVTIIVANNFVSLTHPGEDQGEDSQQEIYSSYKNCLSWVFYYHYFELKGLEKRLNVKHTIYFVVYFSLSDIAMQRKTGGLEPSITKTNLLRSCKTVWFYICRASPSKNTNTYFQWKTIILSKQDNLTIHIVVVLISNTFDGNPFTI